MNETVKKILVRETAGIPRQGEIVRVAVPYARGDFQADQPISVFGPDRQGQPCQSRVLKQWPDGSVKWLLADFPAWVGAESTAEYWLRPGKSVSPDADIVKVEPADDSWHIDTGKAIFSIDARTFRPFSSVRLATGELFPESCCTLTAAGPNTSADVQEITPEEAGPLRAILKVNGCFTAGEGRKLNFRSRLHFFAGSTGVKIEFTIHNPKAARHRGGLWDLGDEGSFFFQDLSFRFVPPQDCSSVCCRPTPADSPLTVSGTSMVSVYQESSGGENWRSPVHRNRDGRVPMTRRGYVAEVDGKEAATGPRATPMVWCGKDDVGMAVAVPLFWQEFPTAVEAGPGGLRIALYPARFPDLHELQGGEQKTREFRVDFATSRDGLAWSLRPVAAHVGPDVYRSSWIISDLPGDDDLVDRFIKAPDLFHRREVADEYGWRHFGEIYADHEAVYHQGPGLFVSHYNNQYDFIAGLYRKFFATGDLGWWEVAGDLARHVRDIDIYHTDGDREEYNHGLFWHTDHYIDAGLSSHRSFSGEHLKAKDPRSCGGGPGAEHCYTTGLMYHYFHTGNPDFKKAVIDLAEWELKALTGPQTVLAALKRGAGYFSLWRSVRGRRRLFPRHPLTRGTGNAVTACLDAFEVAGGRKFLDRADLLIRDTIHPKDDIAARNLLNAEIGWSYTVFLVAIAKFLDKKAELDELDEGFVHARASLRAYAAWMVDNEYPYLDKPEILEYPNETWAAQDLRKSVIFYKAAQYSDTSDQRESFLERAQFFYDYAREELSRQPGSRFSRPVALMLQNGWVGERLKCDSFSTLSERSEWNVIPGSTASGHPTPYLSAVSVMSRLGSEVIGALGQTSIRSELAWLRARLQN